MGSAEVRKNIKKLMMIMSFFYGSLQPKYLLVKSILFLSIAIMKIAYSDFKCNLKDYLDEVLTNNTLLRIRQAKKKT